MALILIFGLWLCFGGCLYRAHERTRSLAGGRDQGRPNVVVGPRRFGSQIPDTVPSDWIEAYRAEHGD